MRDSGDLAGLRTLSLQSDWARGRSGRSLLLLRALRANGHFCRRQRSRRLNSVLYSRRPSCGINVSLFHRHEPLHSFAVENLTRIQVAFRIHGFHVHAKEFAGVLSHLADLTDNLAILAV